MADDNKAQLTNDAAISGTMENALIKIRDATAPLDDDSRSATLPSQWQGNASGGYQIANDGVKATEEHGGATEVYINIARNWDKLNPDEQKALQADPKFKAAENAWVSKEQDKVAEQEVAQGQQESLAAYKKENAKWVGAYDELNPAAKSAVDKELDKSFKGLEAAKGTGNAGTLEQFREDHKGNFTKEYMEEHSGVLKNPEGKAQGAAISPASAEKGIADKLAGSAGEIEKDIAGLSKEVLAAAKEAVKPITDVVSKLSHVTESSVQAVASAVERSAGSGRGNA